MAITNEEVISAIKKYPIVVACVVLALGAMVGLYVRGGVAPELNAQLEEFSKKGRRMATNIKYSSELDQQLIAVDAANKEIDARLVRSDQLAANLQIFYELEATTGTKLMDLRQMPTAASGPQKKTFEPVSFAVVVSGSYPQLVAFLQQLEGGKHFCRVQNASFTPAAKERSDGTVSLGRPEALTLALTLDLLGQP